MGRLAKLPVINDIYGLRRRLRLMVRHPLTLPSRRSRTGLNPLFRPVPKQDESLYGPALGARVLLFQLLVGQFQELPSLIRHS